MLKNQADGEVLLFGGKINKIKAYQITNQETPGIQVEIKAEGSF
jgi:hypothetical protein